MIFIGNEGTISFSLRLVIKSEQNNTCNQYISIILYKRIVI